MKTRLWLALLVATSATAYSQAVPEDSLYTRATTFLANGDIQQGTSTVEMLLRLYPKSAQGYNLRGTIFRYEGKNPQAIEMFRKSIQVDPTYYLSYMNLGNTYNDEDELDSAVVMLKLLVSKDSTNALYHNDLGDVYSKQKDIARAEQCFAKAIRLNPYYTRAHANLGVIYSKQGKYKEALDELFLVRNLDEFYPRLQYYMKDVANNAKSEFKEWVKREPGNGDAHYYYSFYLFFDDDKEEAVDELDKAIAINSREEKYYLLKAIWLWNLKKNVEAITECQACLKLNPTNWKCQNRLAFAYSELSDVTRAIQLFRESVATDSLVIQSQYGLGEAYGATGEYQQAIKALNAAIRLGQLTPYPNYDLAACYYNLGNYQQALQNVSIARTKNKKYPEKGLDGELDRLQSIIIKKMN